MTPEGAEESEKEQPADAEKPAEDQSVTVVTTETTEVKESGAETSHSQIHIEVKQDYRKLKVSKKITFYLGS